MVRCSQYRGCHVTRLYQDDEDRYPLVFDIRKAKLVLRHPGEIRKFALEGGRDEYIGGTDKTDKRGAD